MAEESQLVLMEKITDSGKIVEIIREHFLQGNPLLKIGQINHQVTIGRVEEGEIIVQLPAPEPVSSATILFVRAREIIYCASVSPISMDEKQSCAMRLHNVQILKASRREERKSTGNLQGDSQKKLYISRAVSDFQIRDEMSLQRTRVESIRGRIMEKPGDDYKHKKVFFLQDDPADARMKHMLVTRKPFRVTFMASEGAVHFDGDSIETCEFYKTQIYSRDRYINWQKVMSEISIPVMYRAVFPIGYVQINSDRVLADEDLSEIRKMGMPVAELVSSAKIIQEKDARLLVTDLSRSGMGIVFTHREYISIFKEKSQVVFTLNMPEECKATVLGIVRNITFINNRIYRIGCEILEIDALGEVSYEQFIEKL